ncbi:7 transmembrane receptor (rhodopsin family) domain-containing protein [Ditylenchus destructor]|uniref:7 transmembrane receptor (Rhodopsin family) domain-containing protein n=1 Tax=Ditylenchus destructor TaxID=166010 RepID=A0AAD4N772_9BILA|nr:7 transmembrane receptor (rhodopsin family) domain-containing protein [Ditylenchus destructor]
MNEEEREELARYRLQMYKIVIPGFLAISCLAVLANAVVIIALRATKVRNATVTLILSLTMSDIWTSSIVAFSLLYNSYLPTVKGTDVNPCFSLTLEMMRSGGLITGTLHLLIIAIHHYVGIVKPYWDKSVLRRIAKCLCVVAWLTPLLALLLLATAFPNEGYWDCTNIKFYHTKAFRLSISTMLVAIFIIITTSYIGLLWILRIQRDKWRRQRTAPISENSYHQNGDSQTQALQQQSNGGERKVARENRTLWTAILICTSFFLGWAPACLHFSITYDGGPLREIRRFRTLFLFSCIQLCFILGKSLVNPLIYSLRIPEVKKEIRSMTTLPKWARKILWAKSDTKKKSTAWIPSERRDRSPRVLDSPTASDDVNKPLKTIVRVKANNNS